MTVYNDARSGLLAFRLALKLSVVALLCLVLTLPARAADDAYPLGPDSQVQADVPQGEVTHYTFTTSTLYPGTERDYWVYVPKQYDPGTPACVMFFQDGGNYQDRAGQFRVPVVFDNLIAKKQMPVTIAVMINPGVVPAVDAGRQLPRYNRSFEYDATDDRYARFLSDEILPVLAKKYNLTHDPDGRALCGSSSGGICAFAAAWTRPDQFRRVVSFIGSFTDLRGGDGFSSLVRKSEPKPLRVFLQDGSNDQDIYGGSWFAANNDLAGALKWAGYDYRYEVGTGGHNGQQGASLLPDALRWLWRDYPAPITAPLGKQMLADLLIPGAGWQAVAPDQTASGPITADAEGNVYFANTDGQIERVDSGGGFVRTFLDELKGAQCLAFGPDGRLYVAGEKKRLLGFDSEGKPSVVAKDTEPVAFTVNAKGEVYLTDARDGGLYLIAKDGKKTKLDSGAAGVKALVLTPDQGFLLLTPALGNQIISYQLRPGGSVAAKQPYYDLYAAHGATGCAAGGMATDTNGWLYVATGAGIQVCDQAGRVNGILSSPDVAAPPLGLTFGGANHDVLYAVAGGKVYRRKTKAIGVSPFAAPIKPPAPHL